MKDIDMKNVPTAVWYCMTVVVLGILTVFVILAVTGTDATEFRSFLNTVLNFASVVLGGGAFAFAGVTAKQTNGVLDNKIRNAIQEALNAQSESANAAVQTTYDKGVSDGRPTV